MKNFLTAAIISLIAISVSAGGMPGELVEPTKTVLEIVEPISTASDTATANSFDQLMHFVFMAFLGIV
jgi:hypothetical protein